MITGNSETAVLRVTREAVILSRFDGWQTLTIPIMSLAEIQIDEFFQVGKKLLNNLGSIQMQMFNLLSIEKAHTNSGPVKKHKVVICIN